MQGYQGGKADLILDAAFRLFNQKGYHETKMSDIAELAGIAKGTVYLYFKTEEELYHEMTKRQFSLFFEELREKLESADSFAEKLFELGLHHLMYFYRMKDHRKLFAEVPNNDPEMWRTIHQNVQQYMELVSEVICSQKLDEPMLAARAFMGMIEAYHQEFMFNPSITEKDLESRVRFAVRIFIQGYV